MLEDEKNGNIINYDYLIKIIEKTKEFEPIMLMIYLDGQEVSVDCLQLEEKLVMIPRYKLGNRNQIIKWEQEITNQVEKFNKIAKLQCPFNIQYKYHKDKLYLLEVNTRMSGGMYLSNKIGYNILYNAICKMLKQQTQELTQSKKMVVGWIEEGIILEGEKEGTYNLCM